MAEVMTKENNFIYVLNNKLYVNLTNACTNNCIFCIRTQKDDVKGTNMWLASEPDFESVVAQLNAKSELIKNGITFCGYGEPLLKADLVIKLAKYIKANYPATLIKINTNGHSEAALKKNLISELKNYVDEISISLNASTKEVYDEICKPNIKNAFEEMKKFARNSVKAGIKTTLTVVTNYKNYDIDIEDCKKFAQEIGADFRERPWIENGY